MTRHARLVACLLCASGVFGAEARAQPLELAAARQLFAQGVAHARTGQWRLAVAAFEATYAIAPRSAALFNLAAAQKRTGKLLASSANFRRFVNSQDLSISPVQLRVAQAELADVEGRIPRLRIEIRGLREGDRVMLDHTRIYSDELGRELWLDPGLHQIRVDRPNGHQRQEAIEVREGQVRVLSLRMP